MTNMPIQVLQTPSSLSREDSHGNENFPNPCSLPALPPYIHVYEGDDEDQDEDGSEFASKSEDEDGGYDSDDNGHISRRRQGRS